jgi:hypothetical protein
MLAELLAFPYHGGTGKSESGRLYRITRAK